LSLFAPDAAPPGKPYWWEDAPPPPVLPDRPPGTTDVLVIGAGYTGLSAAIACADAGAAVAVLDAAMPGEGASTRNGGMFGAHPRLPFETLTARFSAEVARGVFAEARAAFDFTRGLIEREGIACDFQPTGRIQMAWTRRHFDTQKRLAAAVAAASDVEVEVLDRPALAAEIATDRYFGALRFPGHAALPPRKFHDGLLAAALRRGVAVVPRCPVTGVKRHAGRFTAVTPRGPILAHNVILATNGYTEGGFRWFRRRVFPLPSFLIATEPLPPELLARLAPGRRMMVETRARHSYFRLSPDGARVLFGGRAAMTPLPPEAAALRLHRTMTEIWPELAGARVTHSWSGLTGYSFTHMPCVGEWNGLHYAMGYSGSGVAVAPYLGMKAAMRALGDPRKATAYARTAFATRPYHPGGRPRFLAAAELWYRGIVDRREAAEATRDRAVLSPNES
jgi:glycine/D-amino acid oxidase-like deaminating enzyme